MISIIPHEVNNIDLQLELLADLTHDPNPDRFDGVPPEYQPEKIMVASLGSIRGLLVQSVVGQTTETQKIYYFINDHLGTPQKLLDENAGVVWSADYKPFGEADIDVNAFANQFRLPGQYWDDETGLHYNWNRYYDSQTGRYLTPDPIGFLGGDLNLFVYVLNDPIIKIDPEGKIWGYVAVGVGVVAVYTGYRIYHSLKALNDAVDKYNERMKKLNNIGQGKSNSDPCKTSDETVDAAKEIVKVAGETVKKGGDMPGTFTGGRP